MPSCALSLLLIILCTKCMIAIIVYFTLYPCLPSFFDDIISSAFLLITLALVFFKIALLLGASVTVIDFSMILCVCALNLVCQGAEVFEKVKASNRGPNLTSGSYGIYSI